MKVLFIGGTELISKAIRMLKWEKVLILNGNLRFTEIQGIHTLVADIHNP